MRKGGKAAFLLSFGSFCFILLIVNVYFAKNYQSFEPFSAILSPTSKQVRHVLQHKASANQVFSSGQELKRQDLSSGKLVTGSGSLQAVVSKRESDSHPSDASSKSKSSFPFVFLGFPRISSSKTSAKSSSASTQSAGPTLVIYVFQNYGKESVNNFEYFLRHGILDAQDTTFVIVVQQFDKVQYSLPTFPANVKVTAYQDCIAPWGVYAWALQKYDDSSFQSYIFLTSSVQGPFVPTYAKDTPWTGIFTSRLSDRVKLVGPIISCQAANASSEGMKDLRQVPHVPQEMVVVDKEGLKVLQAANVVLQCYDSPLDAQLHSQAGSGLAILTANYTLDSLMLRYQGVDWHSPSNWNCNHGLRPDGDFKNDGGTISPLEVVFVNVHQGLLDNKFTAAETARKYADWANKQNVNRNLYIEYPFPYQMARIALANERGPGCFDSTYYLKHNPDLAAVKPALKPFDLWEHFVSFGQHQARKHRWSCDFVVQHHYKVKYYQQRGDTCFDYKFYHEKSNDLKSFDNTTLWNHFVGNGHSEPREWRFNCEIENLGVQH